ncbi:MAG: hypothetical protein KY468_08570 [Armatimonadetes bacterium]|nr:hypothetical protein [Armatimonadota bacterium]
MEPLWVGGTVGGLIGLIPLLYGFFRALTPYGVLGWILCIMGGMAGLALGIGFSILLALILAGIMVFVMARRNREVE